MDRTTLIAASAPVMILVGMVVYGIYAWRRQRRYM